MLGITELAATTTSHSGGFGSSSLILIVIVVAAFYFLMIRPQRRRQQQAAQKQNTLQPGARVRTTAGMYATVVDVDGDDVILEVAPGVEVRYMKRAVMDVVSPGETVDEDVAAADETDAGGFAEHAEPQDGVVQDGVVQDTVVQDTVPPSTVPHRIVPQDAAPHDAAPDPAGQADAASAGDAGETAYQQATGTKKD